MIQRHSGPCVKPRHIPNTNKIMIAGGHGFLDSTEILDVEDGSVTKASRMNSKRAYHGMGVVTIDGIDRLAVFGGCYRENKLDSVEFYNTETEKWETADFKLREARSSFGFLTIKLGDILDCNLTDFTKSTSNTRPIIAMISILHMLILVYFLGLQKQL